MVAVAKMAAQGPSSAGVRKPAIATTSSAPASTTPAAGASQPERKYKCQFCSRAFSRSEHRSRHERSHTKERPFKCMKCRSTFVRRDLLLRHDRTVHAKDAGPPLHSLEKRRAKPAKPSIAIDTAALEQIEQNDGLVDLETAAMLINDIQQKAVAAMAGSSDYHGTAIVDPSSAVGFSSDLSRSWDSYVAGDDKARSVDSSVEGSFDSQSSMVSWNSNSTVQPRHASLAGALRENDVLAPVLQSLRSLPVSGAATPGPYSPLPYSTGPVSPLDYRKPSPLPAAVSGQTPRPPQIENDGQRSAILDRIRDMDKERMIQDNPTFRLPNVSSINRYLSTYFNMFHHHLPFLHLPSFKAEDASSPLLLAVLSIGALYTQEQEQAYMLHVGSKVLINQFLQGKENFSCRKCPLWAMQATLLNSVFAAWSGDPKGLEWTCSIKSLLANMVSGNKYELRLRMDAREGRAATTEEWIEDESCRRTYYAAYIFFGLLTLTYNHTPAMSFNELDSLLLPCSESVWNLGEEMLSAATPQLTIRQAHDELFAGNPTAYSAFATRVLVNALFLGVWHHNRSPTALQDVVTEFRLRQALETWEKSLDLTLVETIVTPLYAPIKGHPLVFNSQAMFRNAKARLSVDLKLIQEALRYHDSYEVAAAMTSARSSIERSPAMLKVIETCFEAIEVVCLQGLRWVARTGATNWSVEQPLCGFDLIVILTLWLWRIEHDEGEVAADERAMYRRIENLFASDDEYEQGKLSSTVARSWGVMIDEVVVWGIASLMGESFKHHSIALRGYEDAVANGHISEDAS